MADTETVTVIRPAGRDPFGDPLPGGDVEFDVPGCLFAPGVSAEVTFQADQVSADATIYGPPGMNIRATDRVRARGDVYTVVGKPQDWGSEGVITLIRVFTG